jgi:dipeptidyl aminopeptidase/acylaminoacyl peptidase
LDVYAGLQITKSRRTEYGGPGIIVGDVVKTGPGFTQYDITYESDGLTITGLVDIPDGEGPFPTIIVNHGYLRPVEYQPGFDSWRIADWLAERGYIALMPDYRNYAGSDSGPNPFHIGYAIDVMTLAAQIASLPQAAPGQIGIIGHSMGGEIAMWPMALSDEVDAIVLYASMSGDVGRNWAHARRYWPAQRDSMDALEIIYGTPEENPQAFAEMSPINYLDWVRMPVMIHHGTRDESIPYWWSEELWHLLQDADVDVTFWPYPGGRHTLGGQGFETFMERNISFFDQHVRATSTSHR